MAGDGWRQGVCVDHRPAGEGTLFTFGPDPRTSRPPSHRRALQGQEHRSRRLHLYTYAAMQVWSQRWRSQNHRSQEGHETSRPRVGYVIGKMEFDAKGDIKQFDYSSTSGTQGHYTIRGQPKGS